jgi:hypothetical protein
MFGILVGGLFFGKPEIVLMVGIGSLIPDLNREYGFFSNESFRRRQIDSLTTTRDRGVEWLYPFSRLVKRAVYDSNGNRMELDPKHKIYFLQNDMPGLTRKTTKDIARALNSTGTRVMCKIAIALSRHIGNFEKSD